MHTVAANLSSVPRYKHPDELGQVGSSKETTLLANTLPPTCVKVNKLQDHRLNLFGRSAFCKALLVYSTQLALMAAKILACLS
jgi:hypothetical protein